MPRKPLKELHRERYPVDDIIRTYQSGKSAFRTGLAFGIEAGTIQNILKTAGVQLRENHHAIHQRLLQLTDKIISMYVDDGLYCREIGDILGFNKSTIRNVLVRNGIERRRPGTSKALHRQPGRYREKGYPVNEIVKAYTEDKLGMKKVGLRFGISGQLVMDILEAEGVPRRTPSEASKLRWKNDPPQNVGRPKRKQSQVCATDEINSLTVQELRDKHNLKIDDIAEIKGISRLAVYKALGF